ncbi:MAG: 3'-5' exoribonuclease YhaM family protein [Eubacteriales bacterium]
MNSVLIKELTVNKKVEGFFMIKNIKAKKAKNGSIYIDITLGDTQGEEINGKIWRAEEIELSHYKIGHVIKMAGLVQAYNGRKQLHIDKIRKALDSDHVTLDDFVETAPMQSMEMIKRILEYIEKIEHEDIKKITQEMFQQKQEKLMYYPAAKTHHHDIKGGLLYHILTMLEVGEKISGSYTFINKDLLYSGIILHDLSKVDEIVSNELGIVEDYSKEGKLLGHIIQGINEIDHMARELHIDHEIKLLIQHMILSHHYHPEYGSTKKPLIPEAELLHYLDIMDARMYAIHKTLANVDEGAFAERNSTLEGRSMYKSKIDQMKPMLE